MSDLSRLRKQLASTEKSGKRLKAELEAARQEAQDADGPLVRRLERRIMLLDKLLSDQRTRWAQVHQELETEERRLVDPAARLQFH